MKKTLAFILFVSFSAFLVSPSYAKGRQPCSGSKGGIQRCVNGNFLCNDGTISRSKRVCDPSVYGNSSKNKKASSGKKEMFDKYGRRVY